MDQINKEAKDYVKEQLYKDTKYAVSVNEQLEEIIKVQLESDKLHIEQLREVVEILERANKI